MATLTATKPLQLWFIIIIIAPIIITRRDTAVWNKLITQDNAVTEM